MLGLTATPPGSLTRTQAEQTRTLFGPILYEARIPALVKEGTLAPYAELAWLTEPTADEAAWLREQSTRFQELTTDLFDPAFGSTPLPEWLAQRFVKPASDGISTWQEIAARDPEIADAALRLVHAGLLELPLGALLHEQHRQPPVAEDWRLFLDDWLLNCIGPRSQVEGEAGADDRAVLEAVRRTLPAIGYVWTQTGIRTGRGTVDRVTARSAAKQGAVTGIVSSEASNLGECVRILVLCDHERATATTRARVTDDATPAPEPAGSATGVLVGLLADPDCADLDPMLVTGKTVAGAEDTLRRLVTWVDQTHPGMAASLVIDTSGEVPTVSGRWTSGQWVAHVTGFFAAGGTRALVGTRGLLGEGWDAPAITTLIDLTTATTPTAVVQTRGRALRIDPANPEKVALLWSVVCVQEGHVAGANDWERYARKHRGYFTVDETGAVVDGVAGVDSSFSDYHPPAGHGLPGARRAHARPRRGARCRAGQVAVRGGVLRPGRARRPGAPGQAGADRRRSRPSPAPQDSSPGPNRRGRNPAVGRRPCPSSPSSCCSSPSSDRRSRLPCSCSPFPSARCRSPCSVAAGCAVPASIAPLSDSSPRRWPTGCGAPASRPSARTV